MIKMITFQLIRTINQEFFRYLLVAGVAFLADFSTLIALKEIYGLHYLVAATLAFLFGTLVNYILSTRWVFSERAISNRLSEFTLFAGIGAAGVLLNGGIIALMVEWAGTNYVLAKVIATGAIFFFNFGLRKWLLFSGSVGTRQVVRAG